MCVCFVNNDVKYSITLLATLMSKECQNRSNTIIVDRFSKTFNNHENSIHTLISSVKSVIYNID